MAVTREDLMRLSGNTSKKSTRPAPKKVKSLPRKRKK